MNDVKTKKRNRLKPNLLNGILKVKSFFKRNNLNTWKPNKSLYHKSKENQIDWVDLESSADEDQEEHHQNNVQEQKQNQNEMIRLE